MTTKKNEPANAMAFYHSDGLTAAWQQAMMYAGKDGRIATMLDIVQARLKSEPGEQNSPWEKYYTTMSAEYLGLDRNGKKIIIVAHGVGPMATLDGVQKTYSWEYKDKDKNRSGGRITQQEFWDLAEEKFGPVSIVDLEDYEKLYEYPLGQVLTASQAKVDPLLIARFGSQCEAYVECHAKIARAWHRTELGLKPEDRYEKENPPKVGNGCLYKIQEAHLRNGAENSDPYIIEVKDACDGCYYLYSPIEEGYAFAHLLSVGALCQTTHTGQNKSLIHDICCHDWHDGTRLIGIQEPADNKEIRIFEGPDPHQILRRHYKELWQKTSQDAKLSFCQLMDFSGKKFTQYAKVGATCDTQEPEYLVNKSEKIGKPVLFRTTIGGYHAFFRYDIKEVKMMALPEANAYKFVSDPVIEYTDKSPSHHTAMLQFYKIEADTKQRLISVDKLARSYELLMKFI